MACVPEKALLEADEEGSGSAGAPAVSVEAVGADAVDAGLGMGDPPAVPAAPALAIEGSVFVAEEFVTES